MTRILLALLLATPVGCFSMPSQAEMKASGAVMGHTFHLGWTLAFAGVGLDTRGFWLAYSHQVDGAADGTG